MRQFINLLKLDTTVIVRNGFLAVVLVLSLLYSLLVNYALPASTDLKIGAREYVVDLSGGKKYAEFLSEAGKEGYLLPSREALSQRLAKDKLGIGVVLEDEKVTIIRQGYELDENINLLVAALDRMVNEVDKGVAHPQFETKYLRPETEKIPLNKLAIPLLLGTDITMVGFILIAAMLFQEKKEGSIEAYAVSPGKTGVYLLSKLTANSLLSLLFALIFGLLTLGTQLHYFYYVVIVFLASFLFSALGVLLGQFYDSLSDFVFVALVFMIIMTLPVVAYFVPAFSLGLIKILPTYSILFGLKNLMFSVSYNPWPLISALFLGCLVAFLITNFSVDKRLLHRKG